MTAAPPNQEREAKAMQLKSSLPNNRGTLRDDGYQAYASLASAATDVDMSAAEPTPDVFSMKR